MIDIEKILKENDTLDGYRIVTQKTESYEVFFVHRKLETVRATDTESTDVTVYVRHDGKLGDSAFTLYASMTEADAAAKVAAAASRALLVSNEPYELPEGGAGEFSLPTNFTDYAMPDLAAAVADAVFAADCLEGGSINATEIFLYKDTVRVRSSRGIDKTQVKYHAMIEAIPTWNEGGESVELYEDHRFTEFDPAAVTAEIGRKMREVRDRQSAVKPQTPMNVDVVLNPHEISSLLRNITRNMDYSTVYSHSNLYALGDDLQKDGTGDKLTVTMAGALEGSIHSAAFDGDGLELKPACVIRDGVVSSLFGGSRFAQYLKAEPTGYLNCVSLEPGTLTEDALANMTYLECVSLSGLQVDLRNDYIGGEIRLAYLHEGGRVTPVTGISMSAKVSAVLGSLGLSDTVTVSGTYRGPDKLLMRGVSIL